MAAGGRGVETAAPLVHHDYAGDELGRLGQVIALAHHEKLDGTGYPNALAGEAIPLPARIVAAADVFDALSHARPYKEAWPLDRVLAEFVAQRGRHFDPAVVDALLDLEGKGLLSHAG